MKSVTHGQCDARPTVTFPVVGHHFPVIGTKLYCLVTEAHVCEWLARWSRWWPKMLTVSMPSWRPSVCHKLYTWILCGCLARWSVKESDRVNWSNPEMSSPHRLYHYSVYPYWAALHYADLPSLSDRHDKLCRDFFKKLCNPSSSIHHLLQPARDYDLTSRLRRASIYL